MSKSTPKTMPKSTSKTMSKAKPKPARPRGKKVIESAEPRPRACPEIGEILRQARIDKGLSQLQVARRMGYASAQYISDWERARSPVPLNRLVELANVIDVDIDRLFEIFLNFSVNRLTREITHEYQSLKSKRTKASNS